MPGERKSGGRRCLPFELPMWQLQRESDRILIDEQALLLRCGTCRNHEAGDFVCNRVEGEVLPPIARARRAHWQR